MEKVLSLIIPTYNMEHYLRQCLDSVLLPDTIELIEVLVINDGSKDNSLSIAREYESCYPQTVRVIDKENGNYGSCVNKGLAEAKGKYVKVLDADDCFDKSGFSGFISFISKQDVDLIVSDYIKVDENGVLLETCSYSMPDGILQFEDVSTTSDFLHMQMHAVSYRRQMIIDLGYHQTEGISYTDQQWIFTPMMGVKTVCHFNQVVYRYLLGRQGQSVNSGSQSRYVKQIWLCMHDSIIDYESRKESLDTLHKEYLQKAVLIPMLKAIYVNHIKEYSKETKEQLVEIDKTIMACSQEIYDLIGSSDVSSCLGFRYIRFWRNHQNMSIWLVRTFGRCYMGMILLRKSLKK